MMRIKSKRTSVEIASSTRSMLIWFAVFCVCGGRMFSQQKKTFVARFEERRKMHECQYKRKGVKISSEYQR